MVSSSSPQLSKSEREHDNSPSFFVLMGMNYHGATVAVRERLVIPETCLFHALAALKRLPHVKEAAVLSTCNRTEVYAVVSNIQGGLKDLESFYEQVQSVHGHEVLKPNFKLLQDDVALHLLRVASGLDSMVIGEGQIMAQVKAAHRAALEAATAGPLLDGLFKHALRCGKRVRTETSMAKRAVSVSSAAVEFANKFLEGRANKTVLLIGAGKMAQISAKQFLGSKTGKHSIIMINRSSERLTQFAESKLPGMQKLNIEFSFEERHQLAANADVVIVSTSAPQYVLQADLLQQFAGEKETLIIDLSLPRNVDPAIAALPNVRLFDLDHLNALVNHNIAERESLIADAEQVIFEMLDEFQSWQRTLSTRSTIVDLRNKLDSIRKEQVCKSAIRSEEVNQSLDQFSAQLLNRILHEPMVQLKTAAAKCLNSTHEEAIRTLFRLSS